MNIKNAIKHPWEIFLYLDQKNIIRIPDRMYLKLLYKKTLNKKLNLKNPQTFNEKLQWLKLNDRKPEYTKMVDKYEAKKYVADIIGEEYIIPTLGVYNKFEEIDFGKLPNQFVIKTTHDSGGIVICKDKKSFDIKKAEEKINKSLKNNFYYLGREWPYKNVKPRIIIERFMSDNGKDINDYKIFVFSGVPHYIQVDYDRFINHHRNFYDLKWNYVPFTTCYPTNPNHIIEKPDKLNEILEIAKKISLSLNNPKFVRIDLYLIEKQIYFGEVTFYHGSGYERFYPEEWDKKLGNFIELKYKTEGEK